jgi:formylglycine-generating enzyme
VFDRDDDANYPATISAFRLDEFEVTVGRFRKFVAALGAGYTPPNGSGIHKHLNAGSGLANSGGTGYEPGWDAADWSSAALSGLATDPNSALSGTGATWTSAAGANEKLPITDVTWYEAYAFCIWDGGFLPSEAEWNYAAEGGSYQNYYPWGAQASVHGSIGSYCNTSCDYPSGSTGSNCIGVLADIAPVGFYSTQDGRWGHADLAGNAWEWTLDWYVTPYSTATCADCADTTMPIAHPSRVLRGGSYDYPTTEIVNSYRYPTDPLNLAGDSFGFRCARVP